MLLAIFPLPLMPPAELAVLPLTMVSVRVIVPLLKMPPPTLAAVLSLIVVLTRVSVLRPALAIPPPSAIKVPKDVLPLTVLSITVSVPPLKISPPPASPLPTGRTESPPSLDGNTSNFDCAPADENVKHAVEGAAIDDGAFLAGSV